MDAWCDGFLDCTHGDDEVGCADSKDVYISDAQREHKYDAIKSRELKYDSPDYNGGLEETYTIRLPSPPPAVVKFVSEGTHRTIDIGDKTCPQTHFQCPDGYCLPVFVLCNGINDCPRWEDEMGCDTYTCPGLYRCRGSLVCLHVQHVCDQVFQCPQHDDEVLCNTTCPQRCMCSGLSYFCSGQFQAERFTSARYIDARGTGMSLQDFVNNHLLIHLSLAMCQLTQMQVVQLPNLRSLDLSDNQLLAINVHYLRHLENLRILFLSRNPLRPQVFTNLHTDTLLPELQVLDMSGTAVAHIDLSVFHHFLHLEVLNLSFCGLDAIIGSGLSSQSQIWSLDIRGNSLLSFPSSFLGKAASLQRVWADNYKVCCPQVLPEGFSLIHCLSPTDAVSSCHSLLKQSVYRVFAFIQASLALLGNVANFAVHVCVKKGFTRQSHGVFFVHLCVSQAVMGVYLTIIAAVDLGYHGDYVWQDVTWRGSVACHLAGLLHLLSTQTSMVLTCLLTLDPLLLLFFPSSRRHFTAKSAQVACAVTWLCCLSVFGSILVTSQLSQTALCVPPLLTEKRKVGHGVVFVVTVVVSWVLLALQAVSQGVLLYVIQSRPLAFITAVSACRHMDTARRYSGVVRLHLLCWLPVGVTAVLTSRGLRLPADMTSILTLVILPISPSLFSAVYYISVMRQTYRHRQRQRLLQRVEWRDVAVGTEK